MRTAALALVAGGIAALATLPATAANVAPVLVPQVSAPAVQPVWYDRFGRWHPPYYGYGYGPPRYYAYGPPHPYGPWRWRRRECLRWGRC